MLKQKILIFIPMYNCAPQIPRVLKQFEDEHVASLFDGLICVNNRSTDDTEDAALGGLAKLKITARSLLRNNDNYGLGGSHKVAIRYAIENDYSHMIVLHGDDQGSINDILPVLQNALRDDLDCLLGARFMKGSNLVGYSLLRTVANRLFNQMFSLVSGQAVYDLGSGLNMYRVDIFTTGFHLKFADDLTFNCYMILASSYLNLKQRFFPLTWREDDQISNAKLFRQGWKTIKLLMAMRSRPARFVKAEHRVNPKNDYTFQIVKAWS